MSFASFKSAVFLSLALLLGATLIVSSPVKIILRPAEDNGWELEQRILSHICVFYNVKDQGHSSWDIFYFESDDNCSFEFTQEMDRDLLSLAKLSYKSEIGVIEIPFTSSDLERATQDEGGKPVVTLTYTTENIKTRKYDEASGEDKGAIVEEAEQSNAKDTAADSYINCLMC